MSKIDPSDLKFVPIDPDPDFDPEHNKRVIEESIKKYEAERRRRRHEYAANLKERTDALNQYLKARREGSNKGISQYFGQKYIDYLKNKVHN